MNPKRLLRFSLLLLLAAAGTWFLVLQAGPGPETVSRDNAVGLLAPAGFSSNQLAEVINDEASANVSLPTTVNLADVEPGQYDPSNQYDRWMRGEIDLDQEASRFSDAEQAARLEEAMKLEPDANVNIASVSGRAPVSGVGFDSLDINDCCGGGANVPPDPELAVGPNHVIAVVNVAFEIYDKSGNSLVGPTTFASFMASDPNCDSGVFDPNAHYDEEADRYIIAIDGDGTHYCVAVSQTGNPTGSWNIYSFATNPANANFFDYPHAGVGDNALYMGGNMFNCGAINCSFVEARVWAFDKTAMYNGSAASFRTASLGNTVFTPQPLNLHGFNQGTWLNGNTHYFITATDPDNVQIFTWTNALSGTSPVQQTNLNLQTATGVTSSAPVSWPQAGGGGSIQGNDERPQDFEYRNGFGWTSQVVACNPGSGTVNCVRWAQINLSTFTVANAGVYGSNGDYRTFADLAVNACDGMAVGYTKGNSSIFPSIFVTGREAGDPAGTLQAETQLKAGEITYTAFDSAPRRWGDYTEMTIAPDGVTFWYLGEYSKITGNGSGRWGTYIGSFSFPSCTTGPTPTPGPTLTPSLTPAPTDTPSPTPAPDGLFCAAPFSIVDGGTATSSLTISDARSINDLNVLLDVAHTWVGDLTFTLTHQNTGTSVTFVDRPGVPASTYGCSGNDIDARLDDEAGTPVETTCGAGTPTINGNFSPNNALSAFDGESVNGTWVLTVTDSVTPDGGAVNQWCVEATLGGAAPTDTPVPPTNTPIPPTNTPIPPTATATGVPPTATNTPIPPTATNTPVPGSDTIIYVSSTSNGNAGGVAFADEDIIAYNMTTGSWSLYFDGSDVGLAGGSGLDINAFHLLPDGSILMSVVTGGTLTGVGTIDDSDIVRFVPTSLGSNTAGSFEWYFDGSDVGLTTSSEDIDAIGISPAGNLLISTTGGVTANGASAADEDLLEFSGTVGSANTSGTFSVYFDGSDVGLSTSSSEDVTGVFVNASNNDIYLNTVGNFSVTGASGTAEDIFTCAPSSLGSSTACSFSFFWDGSASGFAGENMDGLYIENP
ncbi:MAG: hypothetical protein KDE59_15770 [Anaerolineales bacterium]|nr:hypothetical protein [Anaerolineales bacterium]MCB0012394.1 hypothetical protein [Anaerolineales bacterium]